MHAQAKHARERAAAQKRFDDEVARHEQHKKDLDIKHKQELDNKFSNFRELIEEKTKELNAAKLQLANYADQSKADRENLVAELATTRQAKALAERDASDGAKSREELKSLRRQLDLAEEKHREELQASLAMRAAIESRNDRLLQEQVREPPDACNTPKTPSLQPAAQCSTPRIRDADATCALFARYRRRRGVVRQRSSLRRRSCARRACGSSRSRARRSE